MSRDLLTLAPELVLLAGAVLILLVASFTPRARLARTTVLAVVTLLADAALAGVGLASPGRTVMEGAFDVDATTGVVRVVVAGAVLVVVGLGARERADDPRAAETLVLMLLAALGTQVVAGAVDFAVLAVGFLLSSVPLVGLVGLARTPRAAEAAMKTYLLSSLLGIALLGGVVLLTGLAGSSRYAALAQAAPALPDALLLLGVTAVLAGLMVEVGGVPGHFWIPDAAEGGSVVAAAFATTVPKVGALVALWRLVDTVDGLSGAVLLVGLLAAVTMTLGNLAAYPQTDPRRLLGWSTVAQAGYLLVPVAVAADAELARPALLFYLAAYAASNLGAFAVAAALPDRRALADYQGLAGQSPWLAGALLVCLLSLVGTPPTAVFVGKLSTFTAGWDGGLAWLVVLAAVNTVASLFYYLRWLMPVFRTDPGQPSSDTRAADMPGRSVATAAPARPAATAAPAQPAANAAVGAAVVVLGLGLAAGMVWPVLTGT